MSVAEQPPGLASLDLLTAADAARVLGVSRQRVHQLVVEGQAPEPAVRLRRGVLWTRDDVESWATRRTAAAGED